MSGDYNKEIIFSLFHKEYKPLWLQQQISWRKGEGPLEQELWVEVATARGRLEGRVSCGALVLVFEAKVKATTEREEPHCVQAAPRTAHPRLRLICVCPGDF